MLQPTHHGNAFARARMVRVSDHKLKRLFLGSISTSSAYTITMFASPPGMIVMLYIIRRFPPR